jgi:hypothetical protein
MGMFDSLYCEKNLPTPKDFENLNIDWSKVEFQTKSLDNCLSKYVITKDGKLVEQVTEYEHIPFTKEELKRKDHKPWNIVKESKIVNQYTKDVSFHGVIRFYESFNLSAEEDAWVDFDAYFIYDKLDKIELVNVERNKSRKYSLEKLFEEEDKIKNSFIYKLKKYSGWFLFWKKIVDISYKASRACGRIQTFAIKRGV